MTWYNKTADEVVRELNTDPATGITEENSVHRLERYGKNVVPGKDRGGLGFKISGALIIPAMILAAAAALSFATGDNQTGAAILIAAVAGAGIEYYIEHRSNSIMAETARMGCPMATVLRDGKRKHIFFEELVPGDIVFLRSGDIVGADLRLIDGAGLIMDESVLINGLPNAIKDASTVYKDETEPSMRANMCYRGATVVSGIGRGVVVETGNKPEGEEEAFTGEEKRSAMYRDVCRKQRQAAAAGGAGAVLVLLAGLFLRELGTKNLTDTIIMSASLAVAAIPLGMCSVQALIYSTAMRHMYERGALVRSSRAMEELAHVDVICARKTGVLSSDEMTATMVWAGGTAVDVRGHGWSPEGRITDASGKTVDVSANKALALTCIAATLCNDSDIEEVQAGEWARRGDPTECALITMAAKAGVDKAELNGAFPRVSVIPFDPERRMMTTIHHRGKELVAYSKGSVDRILDCCSKIIIGEESYALTDHLKAQIVKIYERMAGQGLRVLAAAYREFLPSEIPDDFKSDNIENELRLCGLIGIENKVKNDSVAAYNLCAAAGIRTVMFTGDEEHTAKETAVSLGIPDEIITGAQVASMSDEQLREGAGDISVCARISAAERTRVVDALEANGSFVSATGTDRADADTLNAAKIGVCVGEDSAETTRSTADMVIENGGYAQIAYAIEESRRCFSAMRSYFSYAFASGIALILSVLLPLLWKGSVPFSTPQILLIGVFLMLIPAFAVSNENSQRDTMRHNPIQAGEPVASRAGIISSVLRGIVLTGVTIAVYFIAKGRTSSQGLDEAAANAVIQTACYFAFTLSSLACAYSGRSETTTASRMGFIPGPALLYVSGGVTAALILSIYLPFLNGIFGTAKLGFIYWLISIGFMLVTFVLCEIIKSNLRPLYKNNRIKIQAGDDDDENGFAHGFFSRFEGGDPTQEDVEDDIPYKKSKSVNKDAESSEEDETGVPAQEEIAAPDEPETPPEPEDQARPEILSDVKVEIPTPEETPEQAVKPDEPEKTEPDEATDVPEPKAEDKKEEEPKERSEEPESAEQPDKEKPEDQEEENK